MAYDQDAPAELTFRNVDMGQGSMANECFVFTTTDDGANKVLNSCQMVFYFAKTLDDQKVRITCHSPTGVQRTVSGVLLAAGRCAPGATGVALVFESPVEIV